MHGEQWKEGTGRHDGAGALTEHLRAGAHGLAVGIVVIAKRIARFFA